MLEGLLQEIVNGGAERIADFVIAALATWLRSLLISWVAARRYGRARTRPVSHSQTMPTAAVRPPASCR